MLAPSGTHLLVSSNRWIFLCSSRLLALQADILKKRGEEEEEVEKEEELLMKSEKKVVGFSGVSAPHLIHLMFHFKYKQAALQYGRE